uniref:Uncharacterized protein n=1 Tax=Meloidogyne floridensis TaxID=298350 RepID=A0A915PC11_9BILA
DEENIKITHELSKNDDEINEEERQIKYFIEDKNLFEIFNKFNKGKTEIGRNLLNICIFANEIGKRFEFFEKLKLKNKFVFNVYFEEEKFLEIEKNWNEIKEKFLKNINENEIENDMNKLLINLLPLFERNEILEKNLVNQMKEKLYFQKICEYFIYTKEQNMNGKLTKNQINFVQEMFNLNEKGQINEMIENIEAHANNLRKLKEQIEIDNGMDVEGYLNPEGFQPFNLKNNQIEQELEGENHSVEGLKKNFMLTSSDPMDMLNEEYDAKTLINNLYPNKKDVENPKEFFQTLFNKWMNLTKNNNFGLFMASPYNKIGGHIQAIIVAVGKGKGEEERIKAKQIFNGKPNTFCRPPFMFNCSDNSLFCYLCKTSGIIKNLHRVYSSDENIQFNIETTDFDITLIHKPETRIVPTDSNWIKLAKEENSKDSLQNLNLAQFKTFEYLENLIKERNEEEQEIISQAFIYLKGWAKDYCIYNNQFGFLDASSISIMLTKVFLLYAGANFVELVERLDKLYHVNYYHKDKNMINEYEQKYIGIGFTKMYKIFIVISCISKMQVTQEQFCSFIESNLYKEIEQLQQFDKIDYCHIGLKTDKCGKKFNQKNNFCTSWLLGIRFNEQIDKQMSEKFNEKVKKIKEKLVNQFVFKYIGSKIEASSQLEIFGIKSKEIKNWGFMED